VTRDTSTILAGRRTRRRGGFTLVEVLAALVLIGIVMPVAMRGVSLAMAAASSARHASIAAGLAESKLNQIVVENSAGTGVGSGATAGDFSPEQPEYRWMLQTFPRDYNLTELSLRVSWQERGQERSLVVTTLAPDPSLAGAGVAP
jgi:prepilin-type N-terminal cleavage/methylation domain-containing protein